MINGFENDSGKFIFVPAHSVVIEQAKELISKYGTEGLRALDSIQLSTAILVKKQVSINLSSDTLLKQLMQKEGLQVI